MSNASQGGTSNTTKRRIFHEKSVRVFGVNRGNNCLKFSRPVLLCVRSDKLQGVGACRAEVRDLLMYKTGMRGQWHGMWLEPTSAFVVARTVAGAKGAEEAEHTRAPRLSKYRETTSTERVGISKCIHSLSTYKGNQLSLT